MRRGCSVVLYDHTEYTRKRAFQTLRASLWDHVANGYLLKQDVEELMGRIGVTETLEETLEKSEVVIESVFEDVVIKRDLFNQMAAILQARAVPPDQITLCSNTMTLPMQAIIEDVQQKEYRGSCIGMRFLHPVWFIDEVELTDWCAPARLSRRPLLRPTHTRRLTPPPLPWARSDYTRRNTAEKAEKLLKQLFFQPFLFDGVNRRKLTLQEISTYQSRQRLRCPEPITSLPRRNLRKKFSASPGSPAEKTPPASPDVPAGSSTPQPSEVAAAPEDAEPCAVCLEEPRSALLVPCGHMAMCVECADKVLHGSRPICVVCRQPIEKILRATPPP